MCRGPFCETASADLHLHVAAHQTVRAVYCPPEAAQQHDDQHDDDQRRESPAQQEVEQVAALRVLVVHHQHLPEVDGLGVDSRRRESQAGQRGVSVGGDTAALGSAVGEEGKRCRFAQ